MDLIEHMCFERYAQLDLIEPNLSNEPGITGKNTEPLVHIFMVC